MVLAKLFKNLKRKAHTKRSLWGTQMHLALVLTVMGSCAALYI